MSYCLNPVCTQPQNSDVTFCQSCGAKLLLRERYRAVRQIGQGGFGKTFLAVDQDLPNKPACVIKQFSPQIQGASGLQKATKLFEQEAVQLNILGKHPQIPELLAHFEQDGRLYLVQEYVKGRNLAEELAQDGAFSEVKIRELLVGLLPVLQYIHDNQVIHRDIKPENIIRRDDGKLFLVDFGAVKIVTGTALLRTGTRIGSAEYAAPEQASGRADFKSDLYSLGVTCLHLLTNVEPFSLFDNGENKWVWRDYLPNSVSDLLGTLLDKMVEKAINRRYQSASTISQDIWNSPNQLAKQSSLKPVLIGKKYGYEDESGKVITTLLFEALREFSEGLAAVQYNRLWGFIDETGKVVIEPKFYEAYGFSNGLARVISESQLGLFYDEYRRSKNCFINSLGNIVLTSKVVDYVGDFHEGLAKVSDKQNPLKFGFIDISGNIVIQPQFYGIAAQSNDYEYRNVGDFSNGFAIVQINLDKSSVNSKYGVIDKTGRVVIQPEFDAIRDIANGLFTFYLDKRWGLIDKTGQIILKPHYISINGHLPFLRENGLFAICVEQKCSLINRRGQIVFKQEFGSYKNFTSELLMIYKGTGFGLIDSTFRFILQPIFSEIYPLQCGLARVRTQRNFKDKYGWYRYGFIDHTGKIVVKPKFLDAKDFCDGIAEVLVKGLIGTKWRKIDKTGKFVD